MRKRKIMSKKKDRKVFSTTANTTRKINISSSGSRGGIRL